jgi:hypothetical protein
MARSGGRMTTTTTIPDQGQPVTAPTVRRRWRVKRPLALDSVSVHPPTTDSPSPAEASQRAQCCDALTAWGHRCENLARALYFRDGRMVCKQHLKQPVPAYSCGDRVGAYGATMALALGDEP